MLTLTEFRKRFTLAEKVRIEEAAQVSAVVRVYLADLSSVGERGVDVADPETIAGVQALAAAGLLDAPTADRAAAILAADPSDPQAQYPAIGGFEIGQSVGLLPPWDAAFPGTHTVVGFGPECVKLSCGCSMATDNIKPA